MGKKHPEGLYLLFFTEMWERFSYYGMRAIFTLYLTKALMMDKELASNIYGSYTGFVYLTPLLGGFLADRYLGNRKSIVSGGYMMALGQLFLFFSALFYTDDLLSKILLLAGLTLLTNSEAEARPGTPPSPSKSVPMPTCSMPAT